MSVSERNKRKIELFVDAVWNEGRMELIDELVAIDYLGHVASLDAALVGPAGLRRFVSRQRRVHPGLYIKIEEQIAEHDLVVIRWQATVPAPPSATECGVATRCRSGISVVRLIAGKQVDSHTGYTDDVRVRRSAA
jgi:predicted SnoaL-like aldol condensation-catalyzing enzyme